MKNRSLQACAFACVFSFAVSCADDDRTIVPPPSDDGSIAGYLQLVSPYPCDEPQPRFETDRYHWQLVPGGRRPAEVRWILLGTEAFGGYEATAEYIRNNPDDDNWSQWTPYVPPALGVTCEPPLMTHGEYVFAVHARDENKVASPLEFGRNMQRVTVSDNPWPYADFDVIEVVVDGPAFMVCWTLGNTACPLRPYEYRYAWNPFDEDDWSPWIAATLPRECSVPRKLFFGSHVFLLEIRDATGSGNVAATVYPFVR